MSANKPMDRRAAIETLLRDRNDAPIVAGLGSAIWDLEAAWPDHPLNFNILGAMGSIVSTALGLAIAQPDQRVIAITGDAEILMGFGTIATVAVRKPENLAVIVIDNERYGETGSQLSHTGQGVDIADMARAAGFKSSITVHDTDELDAARATIMQAHGPVMVVLKVDTHMPAVNMPIRDGAHVKHRFRNALLGEDAARE